MGKVWSSVVFVPATRKLLWNKQSVNENVLKSKDSSCLCLLATHFLSWAVAQMHAVCLWKQLPTRSSLLSPDELLSQTSFDNYGLLHRCHEFGLGSMICSLMYWIQTLVVYSLWQWVHYGYRIWILKRCCSSCYSMALITGILVNSRYHEAFVRWERYNQLHWHWFQGEVEHIIQKDNNQEM